VKSVSVTEADAPTATLHSAQIVPIVMERKSHTEGWMEGVSMGDFENTFGTGADAVAIIDRFSREF